ncbi:hypothetical protein ACN2CC_15340 [Mesorhizobium muleiense]|uniref:hypothetical protein n=1 Tax=Mesorhizobium muleiense TaxID=1004279 RepID=UPI003AFB734E
MNTNLPHALFAVQAIAPQTAEAIASLNEAIELLDKEAFHHLKAYQFLCDAKVALRVRRDALEDDTYIS